MRHYVRYVVPDVVRNVEWMLRLVSTGQERILSPDGCSYQQSYYGIRRTLSRGCYGQLQGPCIRPIPPSQGEDDILQEMCEGLPIRHSGELVAFLQAEQLLDACKFARILHRDNAHTLRLHLSVVVQQYEARYVPNMTRVLPASIAHPNVSDPPCVSSHVSLRGSALRHQESTSSDKVYAL